MDPYPEVSEKSGKRYRVIDYNGSPAREYESGAIQDPDTGKMLKPLITRDNHPEYTAAKERARIRAIENAVMEHGAGKVDAGLQDLAAVQVKIAANPDQGFNATRAFKEIIDLGGWRAAPVPGASAAGQIPAELLQFLGALAPLLRGKLPNDNPTNHDKTEVLSADVIEIVPGEPVAGDALAEPVTGQGEQQPGSSSAPDPGGEG